MNILRQGEGRGKGRLSRTVNEEGDVRSNVQPAHVPEPPELHLAGGTVGSRSRAPRGAPIRFTPPPPGLAPRPSSPRPRPDDRLLVDDVDARPRALDIHILLIERRLQNNLTVAPHVRPRVVLRRPFHVLEI